MGALAACVGVAIGLAAGLAFRATERAQRGPVDERVSVIPEGVDEVLSVLRSSAIVLDPEFSVVKASASAYAFGLIRHDRLAIEQLVELGSKVRRDGEIREDQLEIPRSSDPAQTLYVSARVAPLRRNLLLVLVEDRTQAIRMDEVRRDFVANVSHELKTPVGALSLLAEAVEDAKDDPEGVQRFAEQMQREGSRLTRLVQEIIDLSRLQYDNPVDSPRSVGVDDVVDQALERSRVDAENRGLGLTGGGDTELYVLGNEEQLVVALGNLVENAISYSPPNTRVAVGVRRRDDSVEIAVTDQGFGIADEELERIFERFYRVDPARSRATGGTGLGLSIVKHIAASHGGDVRVWSVQGAGSTFTLRLPLHAPRAGHPPVLDTPVGKENS